jgi:hypothetical protein
LATVNRRRSLRRPELSPASFYIVLHRRDQFDVCSISKSNEGIVRSDRMTPSRYNVEAGFVIVPDRVVEVRRRYNNVINTAKYLFSCSSSSNSQQKGESQKDTQNPGEYVFCFSMIHVPWLSVRLLTHIYCFGWASGKLRAGFVWPRWQVVQLTIGLGPFKFLIFFNRSLLMVRTIFAISRVIGFVGLSSLSH